MQIQIRMYIQDGLNIYHIYWPMGHCLHNNQIFRVTRSRNADKSGDNTSLDMIGIFKAIPPVP